MPENYIKGKDIMQVILTTTEPAPTTQPAATEPATKPADDDAQPVVKTYKLTVVKLGLHCFAWLKGTKPVTIGQFPLALYNELSGELRSRSFWSVDPENVAAVRIVSGSEGVDLKRDGDHWTYTKDPFVKIDSTKVEDYLKDVGKLQAQKFVENTSTQQNAKAFGLDKPWLQLVITDTSDGKKVLTVSFKGATKDKDRYAAASTTPGFMLLPASALDKLAKGLKDFRK